MSKEIYILWIAVFLNLVFGSCSQTGPIVEEEDDAAFQRGRSYLKVGKEEEALGEFLSVTRRTMNSPKSHLEVGRLFLTLKSRKDPVAAIYHFRRFLFLENDSKEAPKVKQLIITAEREIIRDLPGEPYSDYLDSLALKEENELLKREIADLRARQGLPISSTQTLDPKPTLQQVEPQVLPLKPKPVALARTYVVQKGDSLYAISRKFYGDSSKIDLIFKANRASLPSKNSLKLGQKLIIPPVP
ncbi:MAG: LysM peptidoglycan-binding domain-containing protein [Flavobacteriaceae bacterium]|jgi:LysM repeat protein|nr:LysM peptidoglycan-binding domain-containing protein [Flavobacteriaceae bacterium]